MIYMFCDTAAECQFEHFRSITYHLYLNRKAIKLEKLLKIMGKQKPDADEIIRSTTVIFVRRGDSAAMAGDGQVTLGNTVIKARARKVRRIANGLILAGFAGATADAFALLSRLEAKLEQYQYRLERSAIELSKDWRTDKYLRNLEAMLIVADKSDAFLISGSGDVIAADDGLLAVGSGSMYALAAARSLIRHSNLSAREIAEESLKIAAEICIYTNGEIVIEEV